MTIEDIIKIKGELDNKHYIVYKSITLNKTFKAIKTYTIAIYKEEGGQTKEVFSMQKNSQTNPEIWDELEIALVKEILNGRDFNK